MVTRCYLGLAAPEDPLLSLRPAGWGHSPNRSGSRHNKEMLGTANIALRAVQQFIF